MDPGPPFCDLPDGTTGSPQPWPNNDLFMPVSAIDLQEVQLGRGGSDWIQIHQFCYNDPRNLFPIPEHIFLQVIFFLFLLKKKKRMYRQNFPEATESDEMFLHKNNCRCHGVITIEAGPPAVQNTRFPDIPDKPRETEATRDSGLPLDATSCSERSLRVSSVGHCPSCSPLAPSSRVPTVPWERFQDLGLQLDLPD